MIALPPGVRVYLACGITAMRKGMVGLAMLVQQNLADDPFNGALDAFRGRRAGLIKLIWHDGIGLCMLRRNSSTASSCGPPPRPPDEWVYLPRNWPRCSTAANGAHRRHDGWRN
jgi:transposase